MKNPMTAILSVYLCWYRFCLKPSNNLKVFDDLKELND